MAASQSPKLFVGVRVPGGTPSITRFSIMDNTVGFYPTNMGSIPVGEASNTHRWQRGPMQWIANPQNREFESHPVLQLLQQSARAS